MDSVLDGMSSHTEPWDNGAIHKCTRFCGDEDLRDDVLISNLTSAEKAGSLQLRKGLDHCKVAMA